MQYIFALLLISVILFFTESFSITIGKRRSSPLRLSMKVCLHGSIQTRSPLVNWYLLEKNIPFTQKPPRPSKHPFGQVPFLTDNDVEVFESGAILLYLADKYGGYDSPEERASYTKWVVWANSELDGLCFGKGMSGTQLDKPSKSLDRLETILGERDWLLGDEFTVADAAVGSYLNYVPIFFRGVNPSFRPNIVKYMQRCADRPAFAAAFGDDHVEVVKSNCIKWLNAGNNQQVKKSGWFS
mmetsp:Transcript_18363/g.18450  ORF Transcript_18363/g.18450 Transcript_18363/m.18450 type:complete len:241 (+) Transcript_18363:61-783(+)